MAREPVAASTLMLWRRCRDRGIDLSAALLAAARRRFDAQAGPPSLPCGEARPTTWQSGPLHPFRVESSGAPFGVTASAQDGGVAVPLPDGLDGLGGTGLVHVHLSRVLPGVALVRPGALVFAVLIGDERPVREEGRGPPGT